MNASSPAPFVTTRWSVVLDAASESAPASREALETLCRAYWPPIYAFVRRRGYSPEDAQDLTQAFFAHFLERKLASVANPDRGRFRTFLLHCCEYFMAKHWRDSQRLKRGGGREFLPLDTVSAEEWYHRDLIDPLTPEHLYERRWALPLLAQTLSTLRAE